MPSELTDEQIAERTVLGHLWVQVTPARDFGDAPGVLKAGFECSDCGIHRTLEVRDMYKYVADWKKEFWNGMRVVPCRSTARQRCGGVP